MKYLTKLYKICDICISFGIGSYTLDRFVDVYIEPARLIRFNYYYNKAGNLDLALSLFRISIQF